MPTKRKTKPKKVKKLRPPRVFQTKKGRLFIKVNGRRVYIRTEKKTKSPEQLTERIIRLFLKHIAKEKRKRRRKRGKRKILTRFEELEKLNRSQAKRQLADQSRLQRFLDIKKKEIEERKEKLKDQEAELKEQNRYNQFKAIMPPPIPSNMQLIPRPPPGKPPPKRRRRRVASPNVVSPLKYVDPLALEREKKRAAEARQEALDEQMKRQALLEKMGREKRKKDRETKELVTKLAKTEIQKEEEKRKRLIDKTARRMREKLAGSRMKSIGQLFGYNTLPGTKVPWADPSAKLLADRFTTKELEDLDKTLETAAFVKAMMQKRDEVKKIKAKAEKEERKSSKKPRYTQPKEEDGSESSSESSDSDDEPMVISAQAQKEIDDSSDDYDEADGSGLAGKGITTTDINSILGKETWFLGAIPSDYVDKLDTNKKRFGFIMNLDNSKEKGSHWVAIWIDLRTDKSVEYYDPLADPPTKDFEKRLRKLISRINPTWYLKFKVNHIRNQSNSSDTCGFHAMRFLMERAKGSSWQFCTKFVDLKEDIIKKFKKKYGFI